MFTEGVVALILHIDWLYCLVSRKFAALSQFIIYYTRTFLISLRRGFLLESSYLHVHPHNGKTRWKRKLLMHFETLKQAGKLSPRASTTFSFLSRIAKWIRITCWQMEKFFSYVESKQFKFFQRLRKVPIVFTKAEPRLSKSSLTAVWNITSRLRIYERNLSRQITEIDCFLTNLIYIRPEALNLSDFINYTLLWM